MRKIFLLLLLSISLTKADDQAFLKMCKRVSSLPADQKTTMNSLIKIGSGTFTSDMKPCEEVLTFLKESTHLHMQGRTFEYIFVDSLIPITTLSWIKSINLSNQSDVKDITPLTQMNLDSLNIQGTNIKSFHQFEGFNNLDEVKVTIKGHHELKVLLSKLRLKSLVINDISTNDLGFSFLENVSNIESLEVNLHSFNENKATVKFLDELTNLKRLVINRGHIDARELISLPLKELVISDTNLTHVSFIDHLAFIKSLEKLSLADQKIVDASFISSLENLVELNLNKNLISNADFLNELTNLEVLSIGQNDLWQDSPFKKLVNLKSLDASYNRFSFFNIENMNLLEKLNLMSNNLHDLTTSAHPALIELNLNDNNIRSRNLSFLNPTMNSLENLKLSQNKISHLNSIANLTTLKRLELNDNKILSIEVLENLINLERLTIRANLIKPVDQVCPIKPSNICDFLHQDI